MHYMTVLVIEYESTAYQQYKMAQKKIGGIFSIFCQGSHLNISPCDHFITAHTDIEPDVSPDSIADNLINSFESSLPIGLKLVKFL